MEQEADDCVSAALTAGRIPFDEFAAAYGEAAPFTRTQKLPKKVRLLAAPPLATPVGVVVSSPPPLGGREVPAAAASDDSAAVLPTAMLATTAVPGIACDVQSEGADGADGVFDSGAGAGADVGSEEDLVTHDVMGVSLHSFGSHRRTTQVV